MVLTRKYNRENPPIQATEPHVRALFMFMDGERITVREAAELSGVEAAVLSKWRRGLNSPRLDLFVAVCNAVGLVVSVKRPKPVRKINDQIEMDV